MKLLRISICVLLPLLFFFLTCAAQTKIAKEITLLGGEKIAITPAKRLVYKPNGQEDWITPMDFKEVSVDSVKISDSGVIKCELFNKGKKVGNVLVTEEEFLEEKEIIVRFDRTE